MTADGKSAPGCDYCPDPIEVENLRRELEGLRCAMTTRASIEQAKGVIVANLHCTPDEAFRVLVKISQTCHTKLNVLADEIVRRQQQS